MIFRLLFCVLLFIPLFAGTAAAQLPPPISPWMSMFNKKTGPLDNYNTYVKPQQDALRNFQGQQLQLNRQQQQLQTLEQGNGGGGMSLMDRGSGPLDPNRSLLEAPRMIPSSQSNAAVYGQYLHYYQPMQQTRVPNFSQPGINRRR